MLYVFALSDAADDKPIIHFRPYPPHHLTIDSRDGSDDSYSHPSRWNVSYHCFMLLFTFPNLVRKRRCTVTIDSVRVYSSTQNAFSARVAIFTQPAPLSATDVTKHRRHIQTWGVCAAQNLLGCTAVFLI
jgi:hypothetical protein